MIRDNQLPRLLPSLLTTYKFYIIHLMYGYTIKNTILENYTSVSIYFNDGIPIRNINNHYN